MTEKITGKVFSVNQKDGKYGISLGENEWYNGMGTCKAEKGDKVEISYVVNGQWKNIKFVKILEKSQKIVPIDTNIANKEMSKLKNLTNAKICALENAVKLVLANETIAPEDKKIESVSLFNEFVELLYKDTE